MQVLEAMREAERRSSGEIRIYLERKAKGEILSRAKKIFEKLGMTRTQKRNGVLIYFSLTHCSFAVLGDRGIDEKVGEEFWKKRVQLMERSFAENNFAEGLAAAVREIGCELAVHFPGTQDDIDELPNKIEEGG